MTSTPSVSHPSSKSDGHTKLPWRTEYRERKDGTYGQDIFDTDGEAIATCSWYPVEKDNGRSIVTNREANAALIVEAVNNHHRLTSENARMRVALEEIRSETDRVFEVIRHYIHMQIGKPVNPLIPSAIETSLDTSKSHLLELIKRAALSDGGRE